MSPVIGAEEIQVQVPKPISEVASEATSLIRRAVDEMDRSGVDAASFVLFVVSEGSPLVHPSVASSGHEGPIVFAARRDEVAASFRSDPSFLAAIEDAFPCGHQPLAVVASDMAFGVTCPRCFVAKVAEEGADEATQVSTSSG